MAGKKQAASNDEQVVNAVVAQITERLKSIECEKQEMENRIKELLERLKVRQGHSEHLEAAILVMDMRIANLNGKIEAYKDCIEHMKG